VLSQVERAMSSRLMWSLIPAGFILAMSMAVVPVDFVPSRPGASGSV
jgi:hypothetical protein